MKNLWNRRSDTRQDVRFVLVEDSLALGSSLMRSEQLVQLLERFHSDTVKPGITMIPRSKMGRIRWIASIPRG